MTTTIQILSDLHLEKRPVTYETIVKPSADILALVGDIGSPIDGTGRLAEFLGWCATKFKWVFYVPGNHEYYNLQGYDVNYINGLLASMCKTWDNVYFMYNRVVHVRQYVIIGTVLWSHVPLTHIVSISRMMNDYRFIYKEGGALITPHDTNAEYQKNKTWLQEQIQRAQDEKLVPIVLTHHTPSFQRTSAPHHEGGVSCYAFSSQLSCLPGIIRLWCCGHTHYNFHHSEEGYELVSNQYGYGMHCIKGYQNDMCIVL